MLLDSESKIYSSVVFDLVQEILFPSLKLRFIDSAKDQVFRDRYRTRNIRKTFLTDQSLLEKLV